MIACGEPGRSSDSDFNRSELVATVSEFLTVGFSNTCIPNPKRLILTGSSGFCQEEPAVRKALTAATSYPAFCMANAEPGSGKPSPYGERPALRPRNFSAATPGLAVLDCSLMVWAP